MKKLILGISLMVSAFMFAQKSDINTRLQTINKDAMDAYNAKNYTAAAPKFLEIYNLLKTTGQDNKIYLYYAGLNYALANNVNEAVKIYSELINAAYTGVETNYFAKNIKTGEVQPFDKATWELMKGKSKDYTDFKTEQTPSVEADLYETLATLYLNNKKNEDAIALIEKGLLKYPNNTKLKSFLGTAYYQSGNNDKFIASLQEELLRNPNNAESWYNLGVMQSKDPAMKDKALASFQKAVALNPANSNAYQNIVYTVLGDDEKAVNEINTLRKSDPDKATTLIEARKERFTVALPYAEKWHQAMPDDINAVTALREIYMITKNQAKLKEMTAKEAELKAKMPK